MTDAIFADVQVSDNLLLKMKTLNHLQKVLLREKKGFQTVLFKRVGAGLTLQQFDNLVQVLVSSGFCTCTVGERGAVTIALKAGEDATD